VNGFRQLQTGARRFAGNGQERDAGGGERLVDELLAVFHVIIGFVGVTQFHGEDGHGGLSVADDEVDDFVTDAHGERGVVFFIAADEFDEIEEADAGVDDHGCADHVLKGFEHVALDGGEERAGLAVAGTAAETDQAAILSKHGPSQRDGECRSTEKSQP